MFKKILTILLLLTSTNAMAEISISISKGSDNTTIHANHETLTSVLKFYHRQYNTTSTLPASMANEKIDADVKGPSLLTATLRLLHRYNIALIAGKENGLSHISILPRGNESANTNIIKIGKTPSETAQKYTQMIQRTRQAWRSSPRLPTEKGKRLNNGNHNSWNHKKHHTFNSNNYKHVSTPINTPNWRINTTQTN